MTKSRAFKYLTYILTSAVVSNALAEPMSESVSQLAAAKYFSLGNTGIGGVHALEQDAAIRLHASPNARQLMSEVFRIGTLEAKLYVACWASSFAPDDFHSYQANLSREAKPVTVMKGSILTQEATNMTLQRIEKGGCGELLVTSP